MFRRYRELWLALVAVAAITAAYALEYRSAGGLPAASGFLGHGIGILGFVFMLMTQTLYSVRKMLSDARWGSTAGWLSLHMFMGIVGPYMVLLHTTMRFHGPAGVVALLTAVVVASGLVGRYVYTAVPRAITAAHANGAASDGVARRLEASRKALSIWHMVHVPLTWALFTAAFVHSVAALYYATLQR